MYILSYFKYISSVEGMSFTGINNDIKITIYSRI